VTELFVFATAYRPALGSTQPPIQWLTGALTPGAKRPLYESDHSPTPSAAVMNTWSYTSTRQICLHDVVLK